MRQATGPQPAAATSAPRSWLRVQREAILVHPWLSSSERDSEAAHNRPCHGRAWPGPPPRSKAGTIQEWGGGAKPGHDTRRVGFNGTWHSTKSWSAFALRRNGG